MPAHPPRPPLKDKKRLSVAIMERVGAAMRGRPPTDLPHACQVMAEERDAWLDPENPRYQAEREALAKHRTTERLVLIAIASNAVERILIHEDTQTAKAAAGFMDVVGQLKAKMAAAGELPGEPAP